MDQKQPSAGGWQPIETAPRDGTPVIVARHMDEFGWIRGWARWAGGDGFVSGWVSYGFDPVMGGSPDFHVDSFLAMYSLKTDFRVETKD